ncbi:MAG: helix-turn-helix transcriptional regulator [Elusimicrobia bacterium]|nr:helix-turn-helix transcriptional regulator [Elusimicrobiota bacterium]
MNRGIDRAFGLVVRRERQRLRMSQAALAREAGCPQPTVSRLERGTRSATLAEVAALAGALGASVGGLLSETESALGGGHRGMECRPAAPRPAFSPVFHAALADQETALSQLAAHGVRFLGGPDRPALFCLPLEETLLAALKHAHDPRVFEALPGLLLRHARSLDWNRLASGAFALQMQNRLGMAVAAALQLKESAPGSAEEPWNVLQEVHDRLAEARLDREEVLGPKPKTQEALGYLADRTPPWLRFWHGMGRVDMDSLRRRIPR